MTFLYYKHQATLLCEETRKLRLVAPGKGELMLITLKFTFMYISINKMLAFISNPFDKRKA